MKKIYKEQNYEPYYLKNHWIVGQGFISLVIYYYRLLRKKDLQTGK